MAINKTTIEHILRLVLRSIPLVPGPEVYDIVKSLNDSKKSINAKIDKAYQSLKDTSDLVQDLQKDLVQRTEKVRELKDEYERYAALADIEESKAKALLIQLEKTVNKDKNLERIISFVINIVAGLILFVLGIWLGPKITSLF